MYTNIYIIGTNCIDISSGLFLLGIYRPEFNKFCDWTGDIQFTKYEVAEIKCSEDDSCIAFYNSCGEGKKFHLCNRSKSKILSSKCGSILYSASRKFVFN